MSTDLALPEYLAVLYDYNYWANHRMLDVAATLTHEQLFRQQGHSWGSVQGVLVHIRNAEWIWLHRWNGESPRSFPGVEQFPAVTDLRQDWAILEQQMRDFVAAQTRQSLQQKITYTTTSGQIYTLDLWQMMVHVANHGTHHRGELAAMFALMEVPHPEDEWQHYFLIKSGQRSA
jgi:uncharacterized damage-inducible protein DinB